MPNWTNNSIKFTTLEDLNTVVNECRSNYSDFDFNKLIPEPELIEDCPKSHIADENSCIKTSEEKPWFNWYTCHNEFWGVKWNASDVKINTEACEISFSTPWATPGPIFEVLAKRFKDIPCIIKSGFAEGGGLIFTYNGDGKDLNIMEIKYIGEETTE